MKEKILAQLKTKYKNLGLSDKVLEGIAAMLAVTTTEEVNIETATDGVKDLLTGFQADADKRVTDAVAKTTKPKKEGAESTPPEPEKPKDDMPEWAKTLLTQVAELKQGKTVDTRKQTLEQKLKDANPVFKAKILKDFSRMQFKSDEDFNAYVEETATDAGEFAKDNVGAFGRPVMASGSSKAEPSKEELSAIVNDIM